MEPVRPRFHDPEVYVAAKQGNLSKVQTFLKNGGWVDMPNEKGKTMFYYACRQGQTVVVKYLLEHGAHKFTTSKGKTGLEKAPGEVRLIVEKMGRSGGDKTEQKNDLESQIFEKAISFNNYEEAIHFLSSISEKSLRHRPLKNYAQYCGLKSHFSFLLCKYAFREDQEPVAKGLIQGFLRCGDVWSALKSLDFLPDDHTIKPFLELCIEKFDEKFEVHNKLPKEDPDEFRKELREGFSAKNKFYNLSEQDLEAIYAEAAQCESVKAILWYANDLSINLEAFIRDAVGSKTLKSIAAVAIHEAIQQTKEQQAYEDSLNKLLDEAELTRDFSKLKVFIKGKESQVGSAMTEASLRWISEHEDKQSENQSIDDP